MSSLKTVVVADFDETLVHENTLPLLYDKLVATPVVWVVLTALFRGEWLAIGPHRAIKAQMYREILSGRKEEEIGSVAKGLSPRVRVNATAMAKIKEYTRQGADLVVATASLEDFVRRLLERKEIEVDRIIGTRVAKDGDLCNGELAGGECVRKQKANRVKVVIERYYPDYQVIALGNLPADRAMMELADQAFVVDGANITPFR
jgi:phosphatidylglycerophosphatase C